MKRAGTQARARARPRHAVGRRAADVAVGGLQAAERDVERRLLVVERDPQRRRPARRTAGPTRSGSRSTSRRGSSPRARRAGADGSAGRCAGGGGRSRARRRRGARRRARRRAPPTRARRTAAASRSRSPVPACCWSSAPRAGSAVSVENFSDAYEAALPTSSLIASSSCIASRKPVGVELGDLARVALGKRRGARSPPRRAARRRRRRRHRRRAATRSHSVSSSSGSARWSAVVDMLGEVSGRGAPSCRDPRRRVAECTPTARGPGGGAALSRSG